MNGIILIIVTMFAVLGAYFLSDVLTSCIFKGQEVPRAVVLLSSGNLEQMWNNVLEVRQKLPDCEIIVMCSGAMDERERLDPSMRGIYFVTESEVGVMLTARLHLQNAKKEV